MHVGHAPRAGCSAPGMVERGERTEGARPVLSKIGLPLEDFDL
jgi:hypothetical protein